MRMRAILASLAVVSALAIAAPLAEGRPRSHHMAAAAPVAADTFSARWWQEAPSNLVASMGRHLGGNPTGWRRAWCGQYLGMIARQNGLQPPPGYQLARNWARAGRDAGGPKPGAIMVMPHHVGVVIKPLGGGRVLVRSGNHGRRVADGVYLTRRAIAWRQL